MGVIVGNGITASLSHADAAARGKSSPAAAETKAAAENPAACRERATEMKK